MAPTHHVVHQLLQLDSSGLVATAEAGAKAVTSKTETGKEHKGTLHSPGRS